MTDDAREPDDLDELRSRLAEGERALDNEETQIQALRVELDELPPPESEFKRRLRSRRAWTYAVMAVATAVGLTTTYLTVLMPESSFDPAAEKRLLDDIADDRERHTKLQTHLPLARRQVAEERSALIPRASRPSPTDYPCLAMDIELLKLDPSQHDLALRWTSIGIAACTTGRAEYSYRAFRVLGKLDRKYRRPDAGPGQAGSLRALMVMRCRKHDISVLTGVLKERRNPNVLDDL